jgi:predicted flap endonuclease-1-like 5' DNA nuclease
MKLLFVFLIGLLVGWLIEWIIDWVYWRRRTSSANGGELQAQLESLQQENADLKKRLVASGEIRKDKLETIKGIGPVIARKLNEAGIYSFDDLGALTQHRLEEIVGEEIRRLADEDELIRQAKQLADERK